MKKIILKGPKGIGGVAEGEALVTKEPVNLMSDFGSIWEMKGSVKPEDAQFTNKLTLPELYGKSIANKIFVCATHKGGIFSSQILLSLAAHGLAPKAIINVYAHPVFVVAAIMLGIPIIDRLDRDPTEIIKTGDYVKVDASAGIVEVIKR